MKEGKRLSIPQKAINLKNMGEEFKYMNHLNHWRIRNTRTGKKYKQTLGIWLVLKRIQLIKHNPHWIL